MKLKVKSQGVWVEIWGGTGKLGVLLVGKMMDRSESDVDDVV